MDEQLQRAANKGDLDMLYRALAENPHAFDHLDKMQVVKTPLHRAVSEEKINFAIEIMRLKPSFSKKLDARGLSPMHLALEKKQIRTVHRFLETDNGAELVRVKGKEGVTPLHYVVEQGDLKLLNEFLSVSPRSITDTTNRGETALHIAVKNGNTEALEALLVFLRRSWNDEALHLEEKVLNWQDEEGYTVLHAAAKMNQLQVLMMMKLLLKCNVHVNAISLDGSTVLDIVSELVNTA
ncbi:ankyrin repeat-containing protein BDA1-like [Durio zibethinus]|uniref:Ankyrin repeat-containing protein BDA1-like n=1 Tax=Durio zibethinus TaxID=66656 RepID=A0A6P5Y9U4_DURZI|nr:ankyrin repeat-containing protein BDA1-like [Durio zibethinus]